MVKELCEALRRHFSETSWLAAIVVAIGVTSAAGAEPLVLESSEMAGISGFRAFWDRPVVVEADGATRVTGNKKFGSGPVADWSGNEPGAPVFDAVHRRLLVRFPQAAEAIAAEVRKGKQIERVELMLPFRDTEYFPLRYDRPAGMSFLGDTWVKEPPQWHAVAWALRRPWTADAETGPTYNAAVNGAVYWDHYAAQDDDADRFATQFGPAEVSHEQSEAMDLTPMLTAEAFGQTLAERLRRFAVCGVMVRKWEIYDARYLIGGYEWATGTGHRGILIDAPKLRVTFKPGDATLGQLDTPADVSALADGAVRGEPTAVVPDRGTFDRLAEKLAFHRPDYMNDWQWKRAQQLHAMGGGEGFPETYEGYLAWIDKYLSLYPRAWKGFTAGEMAVEYAMYREALPAPAVDNLKRYWRAWLMPERDHDELVHGYIGGKASQRYYDKTGDWRGNASVYRTYLRSMGTVNFNSWAITGAMFGGWIIDDEDIMAEARAGYDMFMTRTWTWLDGSHQEVLDHYYLAHTLGPMKAIQDYAPRDQERLAGSMNVQKVMDELISVWHPNLRRFISPSSRTGIAYLLYLQDGLSYIMHTLSEDGALTDVGAENVAGRADAFGKQFTPGQVALQTQASSWAPRAAASLVDDKPLPYQATRSYTKWGHYRDTPLWKKSYLGQHYGLSSLDVSQNEMAPVMAQWRRSDDTVNSWRNLGTLFARYGINQTEFLDSLYHGTDRRNPNGIVGAQGGPTLTVQGENQAIILGSPVKSLKMKNGRPVPDQVHSLQMSLALFSFEQPGPSWRLYIDGREVESLPARAQFGQRITLHDGVTYLGVIPIPASDLGRDAEVILSTRNEKTEMQGGGDVKVTLAIDAYNYRADQPLVAERYETEVLDKAVAGYVVQMGDATEHGSFSQFQTWFESLPFDARYDGDGTVHIAFGDTDACLEASYDPTAPLTAPTTQAFPARRFKGEWPYLSEGVHRDTTTAVQSSTGRLVKNGATLETKRGKMAYLQAFPEKDVYVGFNPFQQAVPFRITTPEGMVVEADGELGQARVELHSERGEVHVRYAAGPAEQDPRAARALLVSGVELSRATLDGEPVDIVTTPAGQAVPLVTDWDESMVADAGQRRRQLTRTAAWHADHGVETDEAGRVVRWLGQNGAKLDTHEQSTPAARPTLVEDEQTGIKAIRFDGDDFLPLPNFEIPSEGSIFIVYRSAADQQARDASLYAWNPANFGMAWGGDGQRFGFRPRLDPGGAKLFTQPTPRTGNNLIIGETHYRDHEADPPEVTLAVNGVEMQLDIEGDLALVPRDANVGKARIGMRAIDKESRLFWTGEVFAIVQHARRLDPEQRRETRKELAEKYNVSLETTTP